MDVNANGGTERTMKIAVTHCGSENKQSVYMEWLRLFSSSCEFVILSKDGGIESLQGFDGIVLTGGEDIDPEYSKAVPVEKVGTVDRSRDDFEFRLMGSAVRHHVPILGICRGLQVINVFFGGSLIADVQHDGFNDHETPRGEPEKRHSVSVYEGSLLKKIVGTAKGNVNSYHHQAAKEVANTLAVSSFSEDGVVEALEWKEKEGKPFLLAVQWHPERMTDAENPFTRNIGESFFTAAIQE